MRNSLIFVSPGLLYWQRKKIFSHLHTNDNTSSKFTLSSYFHCQNK